MPFAPVMIMATVVGAVPVITDTSTPPTPKIVKTGSSVSAALEDEADAGVAGVDAAVDMDIDITRVEMLLASLDAPAGELRGTDAAGVERVTGDPGIRIDGSCEASESTTDVVPISFGAVREV